MTIHPTPVAIAGSLPVDLRNARDAAIRLASLADDIRRILTNPHFGQIPFVDEMDKEMVVRWFKFLREKQLGYFAAIETIGPELCEKREVNDPFRFGEFSATSAHEVAVQMAISIGCKVWFAATLEPASLETNSPMDLDRISKNYDAVRIHFVDQGPDFPDVQDLFVAIQIEAAQAAGRRRDRTAIEAKCHNSPSANTEPQSTQTVLPVRLSRPDAKDKTMQDELLSALADLRQRIKDDPKIKNKADDPYMTSLCDLDARIELMSRKLGLQFPAVVLLNPLFQKFRFCEIPYQRTPPESGVITYEFRSLPVWEDAFDRFVRLVNAEKEYHRTDPPPANVKPQPAPIGIPAGATAETKPDATPPAEGNSDPFARIRAEVARRIEKEKQEGEECERNNRFAEAARDFYNFDRHEFAKVYGRPLTNTGEFIAAFAPRIVKFAQMVRSEMQDLWNRLELLDLAALPAEAGPAVAIMKRGGEDDERGVIDLLHEASTNFSIFWRIVHWLQNALMKKLQAADLTSAKSGETQTHQPGQRPATAEPQLAQAGPPLTAEPSFTEARTETEPPKTENPAPPAPEFEFARRSGMFCIRGFGESGFFSADLIGFQQIAMLLKRPGNGVPMVHLVSCSEGNDNRVHADNRRSSQPVFDNQAIQDLGNKLKELMDARAHAEENELTEEYDHLTKQINDLTGQMHAALTKTGKPKDLNNVLNKLRPRIFGTLKTAYQKMREANPPLPTLADHFENTITSESPCFVYHLPSNLGIKWQL